MLDEDIDASRLNYYFTKPEPGAPKGLVMISDASTRVVREMGAMYVGKRSINSDLEKPQAS
ncbi:MAG: hypothetical protein QM788_08290 [Roseateles sp.]|uniref:hypothetical protein n=1 Tax=Roseateles sp. TaxID=1971397 RepID=UPI0039E93360